uniref:Uncharacterized protein n=1 Tax=Solanum tuberosum TaxID=4113 RepID=M1DLL5_SOLTU
MDHSASLVEITDQLGDQPFNRFHRRLALSSSIVVYHQLCHLRTVGDPWTVGGVRGWPPASASQNPQEILSEGRPTAEPMDFSLGHEPWSWPVDQDPKDALSESQRRFTGRTIAQSMVHQLAVITFMSGFFCSFPYALDP